MLIPPESAAIAIQTGCTPTVWARWAPAMMVMVVIAATVPEPWDMPGYHSKVIMAAGAFIQGSSIELSADAPIEPPYVVYFQGGLTYEHSKLGVLMGLSYLLKK